MVNSSKSTPTTFLFVEPDITCAVIVCRAAHCVILGRDVLELLRTVLVSIQNHVLWLGAYLSVQEELSGCCVWAGSSRNDVAEILRDTIRARKNVGMERISVEIRDLQGSLA